MSVGKNFDLLKEAVGAWQDHCVFNDCVMNGEYGDGNRLVAWAESDALGVRFYVSDGFRIKNDKANEFVAFANAYVKWGAFVLEPETGAVMYKSMLTSQGNEDDRVNRVRDWLGYGLGLVDGFRRLLDDIAGGEDVKSVFAGLDGTDAAIRRNWLAYAPHLRGSTVRIDRSLSPEGRQIRLKADEVASKGDAICVDMEGTLHIRERYATVLPFVFGTRHHTDRFVQHDCRE